MAQYARNDGKFNHPMARLFPKPEKDYIFQPEVALIQRGATPGESPEVQLP
jgi:hypothetical protein